MADYYSFTEEEIQRQLNALGYHDISHEQLKLFKEDLEKMIHFEETSHRRCTDPETESLPNAGTFQEREYGGVHKYQTNVNDYAWKSMHAARHVPGVEPLYPHLVQSNVQIVSEQETASPLSTGASTTSSTGPRPRYVLRHRNEEPVFCRESISSGDLGDGDMSGVSDRLDGLQLEEKLRGSQLRPGSDMSQTRFVRRMGPRSRSVSDLSDVDLYLPKSYIRQAVPGAGKIRKSDPVTMYHKYKKLWDQQKCPGEEHHSELRWNIRALLLHNAEPVQKPSRFNKASLL